MVSRRCWFVWPSLVLLLLGAASCAEAGTPTERLQQLFAAANRVLEDPATPEPIDKLAAVKRLLRDVGDWDTVASNVLGREWHQRGDAERDEFAQLFGELIQRVFVAVMASRARLDGGTSVTWQGEAAAGDEVAVSSLVEGRGSAPFPVVYRMGRVGDQWRVRDVAIEGVSLVENYRAQVLTILKKSSYPSLLVDLRNAAREVGAAPAASPLPTLASAAPTAPARPVGSAPAPLPRASAVPLLPAGSQAPAPGVSPAPTASPPAAPAPAVTEPPIVTARPIVSRPPAEAPVPRPRPLDEGPAGTVGIPIAAPEPAEIYAAAARPRAPALLPVSPRPLSTDADVQPPSPPALTPPPAAPGPRAASVPVAAMPSASSPPSPAPPPSSPQVTAPPSPGSAVVAPSPAVVPQVAPPPTATPPPAVPQVSAPATAKPAQAPPVSAPAVPAPVTAPTAGPVRTAGSPPVTAPPPTAGPLPAARPAPAMIPDERAGALLAGAPPEWARSTAQPDPSAATDTRPPAPTPAVQPRPSPGPPETSGRRPSEPPVVALAPPASSPSSPERSAAAAGRPSVAQEATAPSALPPPSVAPGKPQGRSFWVEVGYYRNQEVASQAAARYKDIGPTVVAAPPTRSAGPHGESRARLLIGPFTDRADATAAVKRLGVRGVNGVIFEQRD